MHQLRTIVGVADRWVRLCRGTMQRSCRRCYHAICAATAECRSLPDISSETNWSLHDRSSAVKHWQLTGESKKTTASKASVNEILPWASKKAFIQDSFHHVRMNRFFVIYSSKMQQRKPDSESVTLWNYLSKSVVHSADSSLSLSSVHSEVDFRLCSWRQLEATVDVNQILEFIFRIIVRQRLHGPLKKESQTKHLKDVSRVFNRKYTAYNKFCNVQVYYLLMLSLIIIIIMIIIIIIIIRDLYSAIMPLGGYRGAGGTGRIVSIKR